MIDVHKKGVDILVQVYDELLIESPEECISGDIQTTIDSMITTSTLSIPMKVDSKIGSNWAFI